MTYIAPVLGLLAGVAGIADTIPYVRDTVGGTTRPHRGTWLIWSVLAIVVCLSQRADGASWSLIMAAAQAVLTSAVFLLSIRRGEGGLSLAEVLMIALAGGGVIGWIVADEPVIATACVVAADLIGAAMMVPKTYRDPYSETLATFALASLSGALAAGAVGALTLSLLLYPVYFCLVNGAIAVLIHHRRSLLAGPQPTSSPAPTPFPLGQRARVGVRRVGVILAGGSFMPGTMRYPDGGGLSAEGRARREVVHSARHLLFTAPDGLHPAGARPAGDGA